MSEAEVGEQALEQEFPVSWQFSDEGWLHFEQGSDGDDFESTEISLSPQEVQQLYIDLCVRMEVKPTGDG